MMSLIEVNNLKKRFPIRGSRDVIVAVDKVSFDIKKGETFGLIGESGSGKSTVGRCLLHLIPVTGGTLKYQGTEYTRMKDRKFAPIRTKMQMVFQDPYYSLNPRKTVWATVDGALKTNGRLWDNNNVSGSPGRSYQTRNLSS